MTDAEKIMFTYLFDESKDAGLGKAAKVLFEVYESFVRAGFNDDQAFSLVTEILKGGIK